MNFEEGEGGRGTVGIHGAVVVVASLHREGERCDAKRARTEIGLRGRIFPATGGAGVDDEVARNCEAEEER